MSGGGGGGTTTVTQSGPPPQFIAGYQDVLGKAQNVAQTPYQPYPGNIVAPLSPSQEAGISAGQQAVGVSAPYINAAAQYYNNATKPLWESVQQWSPEAVRKYESPYTQDVVNATRNVFNEQNAQQQQNVIGNAISRGAWGGDRAAVAQGILAGQQALMQAPTIANLENQGYAQALQEFNQQQGAQLGANQANAWLNSQAGAGMAGLGQEAQGSANNWANTLLGIGGLEQNQAQAELNVPFQQWQAAQAYPFQTTGWLANIAEGLGGASGGTSSTTAPGPSTASQVIGGATAAAGLANSLFGSGGGGGGFGSALGGLFGSGGGGFIDSGAFDSLFAAGGEVPARAPGGIVPIPTGIPDVSMSVVPGAEGMGVPADHHGANLMNTSMGSVAKTSGGGGNEAMQAIGDVVKVAGIVAAFLNRGGHVGGHTGRGIVPANDDWHEAPRRAAGGITVPVLTGFSPLVTTVPGSYAGSPDVPVLHAPTTGGSGITPTSDYLAAVRAGAYHGLPTVYTPPPPPPPSVQGSGGGGGGGQNVFDMGWGGLESGGGSNMGEAGPGGVSADTAEAGAGGMGVDASHDTGQTELAAGSGGPSGAGGGPDFGGPGGMDSEPGGGGLWARGGAVQREGGGLLDYSQLGSDDTPLLGGIAPSRIFGDDVPGIGKVDIPETEVTAPRYRGPDASSSAAPPPSDTEAPSEEQAPTILANWTPESERQAGIAPSRGMDDLSRTLLYTGLGIMGGTSPHAAVNIGRGALAGLKQAEDARLREELARYRQDQLGERGQYHQGTLDTRTRGQDLRHEEAGARNETAMRGQDIRAKIADRAAQLRQQGLTDNQANAQARLDILRQNADTNATYKGARLEQGDENLNLRRQQLEQNAQRIANSQAAQEAAQQMRREGRDATAINADIGAASRMVASGNAPNFSKALDMVRASRAKITPPPAAASSPAGPPAAAIDFLRQHPEFAPQFRQKYGIDPAQYLSGG